MFLIQIIDKYSKIVSLQLCILIPDKLDQKIHQAAVKSLQRITKIKASD